jgi:aryl-alcohol dehydrogenase-like predicted oxidoreductase
MIQTKSGKDISRLGIGTYLGHLNEATDRQTTAVIETAMLGTINHVDTAPNYRAQRSERAIGAALQITKRAREDTFISSKVGFVPFEWDVPINDQVYFKNRFLDSAIFTAQELIGGIQCFSPNYINWQISESLDRLSTTYLDLVYLHNFENIVPKVSVHNVEPIFRTALASLRKLAEEGKLRLIGMASWSGFLQTEANALHLEQLLRWAEQEDCSKIFRVIQSPFNLGFPDLLVKKSQNVHGQDMSLIRAAQALNLSLITSAPLMHGRLAEMELPEALRDQWPGLSVAQVCIALAKSAPSIVSTLVGIKSETHLSDLLAVERLDPLSASEFIALLKNRP